MIEAVRKDKDTFLANFAQLQAQIGNREPDWLRQMRKAAIMQLEEFGLPTTRAEEWKYTSLAPLSRIPFRLSTGHAGELPAAITQNRFWSSPAPRLIFVNGLFRSDLSDLTGVPKGVRITSLADTLKATPELLEPHLGRYSNFKDHTLNALNTAFIQDGVVLFAPAGTVDTNPIFVTYVSTREAEPFSTHPRSLFVVGSNCQLSLVETFIGEPGAVYFNNPLTELVVGENSTVDHHRIQLESTDAYHIGTLQTNQGRSSTTGLHTIDIGGSLVRNNLTLRLDGEGCDSLLSGLYLAGGHQHIDNFTRIEHAKPHGSSRELYKGILTDSSRAVFHGRIVVSKGAQKTDSKQTNNNLLLSNDALVNTKPQLEIYADDVKCTHGATIGRLDPDALFYLRTRGIGRNDAANLLIYAFASELVGRIKSETLRAKLDAQLFDWLSHVQVIKEQR